MPSAKILTQSMLGDYQPWSYGMTGGRWVNPRKPPFQLWYVPWMTRDPAVTMSLLWVRGRIISQARMTVKDSEAPDAPSDVQVGTSDGDSNQTVAGMPAPEQTDLQKFIEENLSRFWRNSVERVLNALEWGFSGSEVIYRNRDGVIEFENTRTVAPYDSRVVTKNGKKVGMLVKRVPGRRGRVYVGGPKSFWFVNRREINPWYGESKLLGAFEPWYELVTDGGAKDVRRLYYYKYAFRGDTMYYPQGSTNTADANGTIKQNKDLAREIVEKMRAGAVAVMPNTTDPVTGNKLWELIPAQSGPGSVDVLDYYDRLRNEIREGLGVPPEIFTAAQTGSGYSGRVIPQEGFDASLQSLVNWLVHDFDDQILQPLVAINFGPEALNRYEIIPKNLGDLQSKPTLPGEEGQESTDTPTVNASTHTRNVNVRSQNQSTSRSMSS